MLRSLYINNFAIISELNIDFYEGMTSVTGETGAGKSIVIDALALGLGARADQSLIKHGCEQAQVIIEFDISNNEVAKNWLSKNQLESEEPVCILKRQIFTQKPSKSHINDRPVSAASLVEFGQFLVNICGQREHLNLINPSARLAIIDQHSNTAKHTKHLKVVYKQLKDIDLQIENLQTAQLNGEDQSELLAFLVDELSQGNFNARDYAELNTNQKRLAHNSEIISSVNTCIEILQSSDHNVLTLLNQTSKLLDSASKFEPRLKNLLQTIESANIAATDAANELMGLSGQLDPDPDQFEQVEQRLSAYHQMARKHRCSPVELEEKLDSLQQRRDFIENADNERLKLNNKHKKLTTEYVQAAKKISTLRSKSAKALSKSITSQLQQLNLKGSICKVECTTDTSAINPNGQDAIQFLISTNNGQAPGPIDKIASGGELSRISMAIVLETSLQAGQAVLIFDEVDTGISGKTADIVGDKLKTLAKKNQTICITHLPQVACKAKHQLRVSKESDQATQIKLDYLDTESRIVELARFLSGKKITDESLANARVMLKDSG